MSGAGRSAAADVLEDLGWYVVDNLPSTLVDDDRRAGVGARAAASSAWRWSSGRNYGTVLETVAALRAAGHRVTVLFLDAQDADLVRRYDATRRKHPLAAEADGLVESIALERAAAPGHARRRRPRDRHVRAQRPPAQGAPGRRRSTAPARHACRSPSRASASSTACRSTPTS